MIAPGDYSFLKKEIMLILQGVTYIHPNRDLLFADLNLTINKHDKIALIGNNGIGKSTLLNLLAGNLLPSSGSAKGDSRPYYIPQIFGQFNQYSIAQALGIENKLNALHCILTGDAEEDNFSVLDNDWAIEERCGEALAQWGLSGLDLSQKMETLSGGQKTKVFLAGIHIHKPEVVLLDEPSNHLDSRSRSVLYNYIQLTKDTLVVVSHDRSLLNLLDKVCELSKHGIVSYGGNYDFYVEQKRIETDALNDDVRSKEKALRKAKESEKESLERKQKLDARGKKKQIKAGIPTIMLNTLRNNAEKSTSRLKGVHTEKIGSISKDLSQLRQELPDLDKMKVNFNNSALHKGKVLITAKDINFGYDRRLLWREGISFQIISGERIVLSGINGSGKTTLVKLILGDLEPTQGVMTRSAKKAIYIDQDYSLINNEIVVYEQAQQFNSGELQEHEVKIRLNRFLFSKEYWDKPCKALSGGEKMRLMLCSLTMSNHAPDLIVLDEPTNNLDIQNIEILTSAINEYQGTLLVVSHDEYFLKQINIKRSIGLADTILHL